MFLNTSLLANLKFHNIHKVVAPSETADLCECVIVTRFCVATLLLLFLFCQLCSTKYISQDIM